MRTFFQIVYVVVIAGILCIHRCMGAEFDTGTYVAKYRAYDEKQNNGNGYCTSIDSGTLAWGESYILNDYYMLFRVTEDPYWLEKMERHIDMLIYLLIQKEEKVEFKTFSTEEVASMVGEVIEKTRGINLNAHDKYGYPLWLKQYPGWSSSRYSAAMVKVTDSKSAMANIIPDPERIVDLETAKKVTGHQYMIYFGDGTHFGLTDINLNQIIAPWVEFKPGEPITTIPGVSLKVEWTPEKGDTFYITTIKQMPLQFVAHDGMLLYPIARFIEVVIKNTSLQTRFGEKANSYKRLILEVFARKWDGYWAEFPTDTGTYKCTESPAEITPNWVLPINQNNAMGRVFMILQENSVAGNQIYKDRARKLANYFKYYLRPNGNGWTWNYREYEDPASQTFVEDTSHAITDIEFALEAHNRGIVFTQEDMNRFAFTLLGNMWNGSMEAPEFGNRVNLRGGDGWYSPMNARGWIGLCRFNRQIWDVCAAWFRKNSEPVVFIPYLLYAQKFCLKH